MSDWFASLEPGVQASVLSAATSTLAVVIATFALRSQAKNAQRQARLTLLEKRLQVYTAASDATSSLDAAVSGSRMGIRPQILLDQLTASCSKVSEVLLLTKALFGDNVSDHMTEIMITCTMTKVELSNQRFNGSRSIPHLETRIEEIKSNSANVFHNYVMQDRFFGLPFLDRAEIWFNQASTREHERMHRGEA